MALRINSLLSLFYKWGNESRERGNSQTRSHICSVAALWSETGSRLHVGATILHRFFWPLSPASWIIFFFFLRFYLFLFREGKEERKKGREKWTCGCLAHAPYWGPGLQPRHVPWLGIEPLVHGPASIRWTTPASTSWIIL